MARKDPQASRTPMPRAQARARLRTFGEVAHGYAEWQAVQEANRCLGCAAAPCADQCPLHLDIRTFLAHVADGDFDAAYATLTEASPLPGVCSRVCRQESHCERECPRPGDPVAIGRLERFVADWGADRGRVGPVRMPVAPSPHAVAVIGSGPAGLVAAADLARRGHAVTIFEGREEPGGMLTYGIPEFRLPQSVVEREISALRDMGVSIRVNQFVGRTFSIDDLFNDLGYEAVFLAAGASSPQLPDIPGVELGGVFSAHDYLAIARLINSSGVGGTDLPSLEARYVTVIGGGDSALDCARTAARFGAAHVRLVYRRSRHEMIARREEIAFAAEEGIEMIFLAAPMEVLGDAGNHVAWVRFQEMQLGEPDASGRRAPQPLADAFFELPTDLVIFATGGNVDPLLQSATPALEFDDAGQVIADAWTGATAHDGLFAGGHVVNRDATVGEAMGDGRRAAAAIDDWLRNRSASWPERAKAPDPRR